MPHAVTTTKTEQNTSVGPAAVETLVDALGLAWATFTLYEDPTGLDAFSRAVETLSRCPRFPYVFQVGPDGFHDGAEVIAHKREATVRLARRIFGTDSSGLEVTSPPNGKAILRLFRVLAAGDADDPNAALREDGIHSVSLVRSALADDGLDDEGDDAEGPWYLSYSGDPEPFVSALLADAEGDPSRAARAFVAEYERAASLVDAGDRWGADEVIRAFVDAFWYLPNDHRSQIFSLMLERRNRSENLAFLDQFGSMELAEMNQTFGSTGHPLLAEYLRVAAEEGGRQTTELASGGSEVSLGRAVIDQVASVLSSTDPSGTPATEAALIRLRAQAPGPSDHGRAAMNVVRGMLSLAGNGVSTEAAAAVWASRTATALSHGNPRAAEAWLKTLSGLDLDAASRGTLMTHLAKRLDDQAVDTIVDVANAPDAETPLLVRFAPLFAVGAMIDRLGAEPDRVRRKRLVDALIPMARVTPEPVVARLEDPRWYLARNAVSILGHTAKPAIGDSLMRVARHEDARVRIEVIRALIRLGDARSVELVVTAIEDAETRAEGIGLVSRIPDPRIDERLAERFAATGAAHLIEALIRRGTPRSREVLEAAANRRFAWFGEKRRVRVAAAEALRSIDG